MGSVSKRFLHEEKANGNGQEEGEYGRNGSHNQYPVSGESASGLEPMAMMAWLVKLQRVEARRISGF